MNIKLVLQFLVSSCLSSRHTKRENTLNSPEFRKSTSKRALSNNELRLLNNVEQPSVRGSYEPLPIMCLTCSINSQDKACQNPTEKHEVFLRMKYIIRITPTFTVLSIMKF